MNWSSLFRASSSLDIFFCYGGTWRNTYIDELRRFVSRPGTRATIVLADPEDERLMREVSLRFNSTPEAIRAKILDAKKAFVDLFFDPVVKEGRDFSVWHAAVSPVFSCYFFDGTAIVTLYKHKAQRAEVPTIVVKRGGELFHFFRTEFDALISGSEPIGRRVFPEG